MTKIGLLGGTFDPPHLGHLIMAEATRTALQLAEVWFIPTHEPPHKDKAYTSTKDRITMLEMSIQGNDFFKMNTIELTREGKSYTVDTIKQLKKDYPDVEFYFILGADMVEYLPHWKKIDELLNLVHFVGVSRPGYKLKTPYDLTLIEIPTLNISSTAIRNRIQHGESITYLVHPSVNAYIKEKRLYEYRSSDSNY